MRHLAEALFTAAFVYFASLNAGRILLLLALGSRDSGSRLRVYKFEFYRSEERFIGFVLGAGCLSLMVFLLAAAHLAYKGVFLALGIALILAGRFVIRGSGLKNLPPLARGWRTAFAIGYALYAVLYLANGLLPDTSPDGNVYHVGLMAQYYRAHSLPWLTTSLFADLSQGIEMLFLFAWPFARQAGAPMVHVLFLLALPFGILSYARRFGMPAAGVMGALLVFMSPVAGIDGVSAYVDVAVAAIVFAVFYLLQIWAAERNPGLLVPIGLLCGFAYGAKYVAYIALPYALLFVVLHLRGNLRVAVRAALVVAGCSAILVAPWMIKNALVVGNPISPLGNEYFRNPFIHISTERSYVAVMSHFNGVTYRQLPWELCVSGRQLLGLIGPVFLLSVIGLAAVRWPAGRQLLIAAAIFGGPQLIGIQTTRWFITALPFVALALAMVLCRWRPIALAVLAAHAVLGWPAVAGLYCGPGIWRITGLPWRAALRLENEDHYLARVLGESYEMSNSINKLVPAGQPIFSIAPFGRAYVNRDIIVAWESAFGERMSDALGEATRDNIWRMEYVFPSRRMSKIRLLQMEKSNDNAWGIDELRFYRAGQELPRLSAWRLSASPNPWDVQLAFDNNPVTRWFTWEHYQPGMYIAVDFGGATEVDRVVADCSPDSCFGRVAVQAWSGSAWQDVGASVAMQVLPAPAGSRRAAAGVLKQNGLHWLLFDYHDFPAKDLVINRTRWGIKLAAASSDHRLYHIE